MDPTLDPTLEGREQLKELERRLAIFIYEGELMEKCLTRRIRRVIKAIGQGSIAVSGFPNEIHYMLLELADNDLREHATQQKTLDVALNMRILHQVALAIETLHFNQIAHQDLKPSNVLMFDDTTAKVGDLGHAHDRGSPRPGLSGVIAGY
jgi:serine/threonine protein kinase